MIKVQDQTTRKIQVGAPTLENPGRGFRVDTSGLQRAAAAPQINSRGFLAEAMAGASVGQGLQSLGGSLDQIQAHMAEAVNKRHIAEAEMSMQQAQQDIAAEIAAKPNNPELWEGIAQKRLGEAQKTILHDGMSPAARAYMEPRARQWATTSAGETKIAAIKQQFNLTSQTLQVAHGKALEAGDYAQAADIRGQIAPYVGPSGMARLEESEKTAQFRGYQMARDTALNNGDIEGAKHAAGVAKEAGLLKQPEYDLELSEIGGKHEARKQADEIQALTLKNPAEAVRQLEAGKWSRVSDGDRQAAIVHAKQVQSSFAVDAFRDAKTRVQLGQVKEGEAFDGPGMESLTPLMRDVLKAENVASHDERMKALRVSLQNSPAIYENAVGVIAKYDPAADAGGLRKAEIGAALETHFSGPHLDELRKRLDDRGSKPPGMIDVDPALALIKEWTDGGGLGEFKIPVTQDGVGVVTEPKKIGVTAAVPKSLLGIDWLWPDSGGKEVMGESKPVTEIDATKQAQAAAKQATIRKTLEAEAKAGRFKSNDEVINRAVELYQQAGGKAPSSSTPAATGALLLLPELDKKQKRALEILNFKPTK